MSRLVNKTGSNLANHSPVLTFGKLDSETSFKPMFFHEETDIEKISTKITVDWNITPETMGEPEKLSESYQTILSFQDFTDFFGDLKEKQQKVMAANNYNADTQKYLGELTYSQRLLVWALIEALRT